MTICLCNWWQIKKQDLQNPLIDCSLRSRHKVNIVIINTDSNPNRSALIDQWIDEGLQPQSAERFVLRYIVYIQPSTDLRIDVNIKTIWRCNCQIFQDQGHSYLFILKAVLVYTTAFHESHLIISQPAQL